MAPPRTRRVQQMPAMRTGQEGVDRALDSARDVVNRLARATSVRAVLRVKLQPGLNKLDHGIGRAPVTFSWTTDVVGAVVSTAQADNPFPARNLWVRLSGTGPADAVLLVYA